jgi:hypothetical protein
MRDRFVASLGALAIVMAVVWLAPAVAAQAPSASPAKTPAAKATPAITWTAAARTPDGQPDLQGYWTSLSFTPMERAAKYGGREFLTDAELAEVFKSGVQHSYEFTFANSAETPVYDATVYALDAWQNGVKPNRRTSLVVDPPDGKIPPLTPEAQARPRGRGQRAGAFDGPEDLGLGVRCLSFGGPPILPGAYNNNSHIVQGPGYVMIEYEWNSEPRVIPLDGRPHISKNIRPWHGDSRGRWEGNTLLVETTNFRPGATYQNANADTLRIIERFTRVDAGTIDYKFTIDDPMTWTKPWSAIVPMSQVEGPLFEYACTEGNNGAVNILEGARAADKAAAEAAKKESK